MVRFDFSKRVVAITGPAGGLATEMVEAFAEAGADIALLDRNRERGLLRESELQKRGVNAKAFLCDVTDKAMVDAAAEGIKEAFGGLDVLINVAGGNQPGATTKEETVDAAAPWEGSFFKFSVEAVDAVWRLNFLGTLYPIQALTPLMFNREGANIINISSMNAITPLTKVPIYAGAKAAVSNLTQWLAVYLAPTGIRVNGIAPGFFDTAQVHGLFYMPDGTPAPRTKKIITGTPFARFGLPEDLTGTAMYLADGSLSGFVTGVVIPVDGGFSSYTGV